MAARVQGETLARTVLGFGALAFVGIGLAFLCAPQAMAHHVGLALEGATADNDVRAVYGGLQIACGLALARAACELQGLRAALELQILLFCGLAGARFVSLALAGIPTPLALGLHGAELVAIVCSGVALRALPPTPTR